MQPNPLKWYVAYPEKFWVGGILKMTSTIDENRLL